MSRALPGLLLCLALVLGGILYFEAAAGPSGAEMIEPAARQVAKPLQPVQRAPAEDTAPWVATILARPLFSPTRRPPAPSAGPAKPAAEMPRLAGVLVSEAGSEAIFAQAGQKPSVVRAGDRIGPYLVTSISAGEVTLSGPAGTVTLHPAFASGAEQPAPTAPAARPVGKPFRPSPAAQPGLPSLEEVQSMIARQQAEMPK
ncbi:MAG TPA: hypothetical protein VJ779_08725 [Acetobacteraceae bacterium]|jgi:general secretion pathway protein N|nr:hypothetical protein [Acetobacteraceae bacterium]